MLPIRALRLTRHDATTLDRMAFEEGELVFDSTNGLIRLMDGNNFGGKKLANQVWATSAISTAITANNVTVNAAIALKAPINNPGFTGTVTGITATMVGLGNVTNESKATMFNGPTFTGTATGTFSGPLTGNVTGNVSGTSGSTTGNAATATKLAAPTNINGVAFDGSASISVSTLVNNGNTVTLASNGALTVPGTMTAPNIILDSGNISFLGNGSGLQGAMSFNISTNSFSNTWNFSQTGDLTAPGNIITSTGTVTANAATITTAVTVGTNVNISTLPTQPQHASNKKYVDARSVAMSIAMS
jgi:hypothetical protein